MFINRLKVFLSNSVKYAKESKQGTHKPTIVILIDMFFCLIFYGMYPDGYRHIGFSHMKTAERKKHIGFHAYNRIMKRFNQTRGYSALFLNRYYFSKVFADLYGRTAYRSLTISTDEYAELCRGGRFIYKPLCGVAGQSIKLFDADRTAPNEAAAMLRSLPNGIIEPIIPQHEALNSLYPNAVNPVRVTTVYKDGKCSMIYGTLSLGLGLGFANASQDAIFAIVDVNNGSVISNAYGYDHKKYVTHPLTNRQIKGFEIPMWDEVKALLEKAAARVPEIGFVGWDIAITPNGPLLIEGNHDGGFIGYQFYELRDEGIDTETKKLFDPLLKK